MSVPPLRQAELVVFDPNDLDTYPSVCQTPEDVEFRFGFKGGELLLFDGPNYIGEVVKQMVTNPIITEVGPYPDFKYQGEVYTNAKKYRITDEASRTEPHT